MDYYDLDSNEIQKDPQFITEFFKGDSLKRIQHTKTGEQIYLAFLDSMVSYVLLDFYGEKYAVKIPIELDSTHSVYFESWGSPDVHELDSNFFTAQGTLLKDSLSYEVGYTKSIDARFNQFFQGLQNAYVLSYTILVNGGYYERKKTIRVESFKIQPEAFAIPEEYKVVSLQEFSSMK